MRAEIFLVVLRFRKSKWSCVFASSPGWIRLSPWSRSYVNILKELRHRGAEFSRILRRFAPCLRGPPVRIHRRKAGKEKNTPTGRFFLCLCAGLDSNQRRINPTGLQPVALDHSATDAWRPLCTKSINCASGLSSHLCASADAFGALGAFADVEGEGVVLVVD